MGEVYQGAPRPDQPQLLSPPLIECAIFGVMFVDSSALPDSAATNPTLPDFSTPMMQQYLGLKKQYPDCILLFRLGDFYEMFLDDAKLGAQLLGIVLTSRSRGKDGRIPMAGVPYHALDSYLPKLLAAGVKVAICDQMTQPNGRDLVERQVTRIITAGTVLDSKSLITKQHNYLWSIHLSGLDLGFSATDISTGDVFVDLIQLSALAELSDSLEHLAVQLPPSECIISLPFEHNVELREQLKTAGISVIHPFDGFPKQVKAAKARIAMLWPTVDWPAALSSTATQIAVAGLLEYIAYTQKMNARHMLAPRAVSQNSSVRLDPATVRNLELFRNLHDGTEQHTLLSVIDHTHTAMGGRLLKLWLAQPLAEAQAISTRQDIVEWFVRYSDECTETQQQLRSLIDLERVLSRLSLRIGNPRDVRGIAETLQHIEHLNTFLRTQPHLPEAFQKIFTELQKPAAQNLAAKILSQICDDPPVDPHDGGVFQPGQLPRLDELSAEITQHQQWMAEFESSARKSSGISTLKIKFNQVFGYYIEVSNANLHLVPPDFQRKQTLVNAERFTTPALKEHEQLILSRKEEAQRLEVELFEKLVEEIVQHIPEIQKIAHAVAQLDCLAGFAETAIINAYARPSITSGGALDIQDGRHPVVESSLKASRSANAQKFVPNSAFLDTTEHQLMLLTGPNMAGKSVFMRQIALITIMAHLGSFVPATSAHIPLIDQIFVRSGAADMISAGRSTFMVEMVETATILRRATPSSLIIMDEIGRGTSTYDGISIAWAIAEFLVTGGSSFVDTDTKQRQSKNLDGPKTLFATHYHELQTLEAKYPQKIHNFHMAIAEKDGRPVFLYQIEPGGASHSFGIAVAELAGLPDKVLETAKKMIETLERSDGKGAKKTSQLHLEGIDMNNTTPLQAHKILQELLKNSS